ncbi:TPA: hypothetical protein HA235_07495 [Candidatus Woesearchaeota archaeon]|nr:hypothetical protein [Candidatus Woesearchaeota archaeon]HIH32522.1 hypothetical protein [Candidatus Woesearchaeota archaeon]HIH55102.1 hypothetical protein [Candidatus Woesearchaeota archaeon]HIJ01705.1 hypothetical protein [Candidatus Woesearchaeota archaeon]HIJ13255.1 hypothetical protein [Candidatus Woesearchaeota archaeon]
MRPFNKRSKFDRKDSDRSGKREFRGDSSEKGRNRRDLGSKDGGFQLHHATCDKCGRPCDVPFKPTGNKPIYCRSCFRENSSFESNRGSNSFNRSESRGKYNDRPESRNTSSSEDLEKINRKLDKIMRALKIE